MLLYIKLIIFYLWFLAGLYAIRRIQSDYTQKSGAKRSFILFISLFLGPIVLAVYLAQKKGISLKTIAQWIRSKSETQGNNEHLNLILLDNQGRDVFANRGSRENLDCDALTYVRKMIYEAIVRKSSDIFIDPKDSVYAIRFRVDGAIRVYDTVPTDLAVAIVSMVKVLSGMDIAEKRRPQDGSFSCEYRDSNVSFRVATVGVFGGEKVTIRVIASENSQRPLADVGFSLPQLELVKNSIKLPSGMVLMCGPTGSGKTSTLYSMLGEIDYSMKNVISIEDPIERVIPRISQMEVNAKANITFASLLRNCMRQNPDIICIGEIRDEETAEIASHAAQTGHLIIATLHSNDNIGTILRLIDLGVPMRSIAGSLHLVISQRLVRKLCPKCKKKIELNEKQKAFCKAHNENISELYTACGCSSCNGSGYSGRKAVFEMLVMDDKLRAVMEDPNTSVTTIQQYLQKTRNAADTIEMMTFKMMLDGETSWEEFERVNINL